MSLACVPLGRPSALDEYDARLRAAISPIRRVTGGYWDDAGTRDAVDEILLAHARYHLTAVLHGMAADGGGE